MKKELIILILVLISNLAFGQCAKYEPPDGNVMLIIGQDMNATGKMGYGSGYADDASLGNTAPAGITTYYSTTFSGDPNVGIYSNADWGAGALCANCYTLSSYYNSSVIVIGLYMVNDLNNVISGARDTYIDALGNWIKSVSPRPVFLRIGYEFDYQYGCCSAQYVQAWQHIVDRFRNVLNVSNVAFVWQAASGSQSASILLQWYPGDSYVDWFAYSHFYGNSGNVSGNLLDLARTKRKPVMIAEATPYGYDLSNSSSASSAWANYFSPLFTHINNNIDVIKALAYINQDWDAQPAWSGQGWGNSRIQADGDGMIRNNWLAETSKPYWLHGSSALFALLQNSNTQQPFGGAANVIPGTIQAEDFDMGCEGLSYYDNSGGNSGGSVYRYGYSVDIGTTSDASGSYDVGWTASGEWLSYTVNTTLSGNYNFKFRISTANSGNSFHIEQDGINVSGPISVPNTGSWSVYSDVTVNSVSLSAGTHVLKIYFDNVPGFNINYFEISSSGNLPVTFESVNVYLIEDGIVALDWITSKDKGKNKYVIERSSDGITFHKAGEVLRTAEGKVSYSFYDSSVLGGLYYYRIMEVDPDGSYVVSNVYSVSVPYKKVLAYPNPCSDYLVIECKDLIKAEIFDMFGRSIALQYYNYEPSKYIFHLDKIEAGYYFFRFADIGGNIVYIPVIVKK